MDIVLIDVFIFANNTACVANCEVVKFEYLNISCCESAICLNNWAGDISFNFANAPTPAAIFVPVSADDLSIKRNVLLIDNTSSADDIYCVASPAAAVANLTWDDNPVANETPTFFTVSKTAWVDEPIACNALSETDIADLNLPISLVNNAFLWALFASNVCDSWFCLNWIWSFNRLFS